MLVLDCYTHPMSSHHQIRASWFVQKPVDVLFDDLLFYGLFLPSDAGCTELACSQPVARASQQTAHTI